MVHIIKIVNSPKKSTLPAEIIAVFSENFVFVLGGIVTLVSVLAIIGLSALIVLDWIPVIKRIAQLFKNGKKNRA